MIVHENARMQFGGTMGERMKSAYGAFCSRHNDALQLYKALLKSDVTFQEFIKVSKHAAKICNE